MNKRTGLLAFVVAALLFAACQKSANNSPYPQISFNYLTPDSVTAGLFTDTVYLSFNYTDGDADLGVVGGNSAIHLIDSRDSSDHVYPFPDIPDGAAHDRQNGISGNTMVLIQGAALIPRPDTLHTLHGDTLSYTTYLVDSAGHESNRFNTPSIYIRPR